MKSYITLSTLTLSLLASAASIAGEAEDAIIAKVVDGYGGKNFTQMKSVSLTDRNLNGGVGQGYLTEFSSIMLEKEQLIGTWRTKRVVMRVIP